MNISVKHFKNYSGYEQRECPPEDPELTHVGVNTPCGKYLRQFWHGIALSEELTERIGRINALFRDPIEYCQVIKPSSTCASTRCWPELRPERAEIPYFSAIFRRFPRARRQRPCRSFDVAAAACVVDPY